MIDSLSRGPEGMDEFLKASLSLAVTIVGLGLTWFIGNRIAAFWAERQKRRELELALANAFYSHYGEFRAIWRFWNQSVEELAADSEEFKRRRETLLDRASIAEGALEAALLKVSSERLLTFTDQEDLGNLRQAFQVLRERIQENIPISYGYSEHQDYLEFKRLATRFGTLLASRSSQRAPTPEEAFLAFREITDNKYQPRWKRAGKNDHHHRSSEQPLVNTSRQFEALWPSHLSTQPSEEKRRGGDVC